MRQSGQAALRLRYTGVVKTTSPSEDRRMTRIFCLLFMTIRQQTTVILPFSDGRPSGSLVLQEREQAGEGAGRGAAEGFGGLAGSLAQFTAAGGVGEKLAQGLGQG